MNQRAKVEPIFHALGDATRRAIIERLALQPCSVSSLAEPLGVTLTAVSQHLAVLEAAGLVRTEKTGRVRSCWLVPGGFGPLERWIAAQRSPAERQLDALGQMLSEDDDGVV